MKDFVYVNVNEDGEAYGFHTEPTDALALLEQFPNDMIVVVVHGSSIHLQMVASGRFQFD